MREETQRLIEENNRLIAERDKLRTAMRLLKTSIEQDPTMDTQVNNWMLGIIDTGLGVST